MHLNTMRKYIGVIMVLIIALIFLACTNQPANTVADVPKTDDAPSITDSITSLNKITNADRSNYILTAATGSPVKNPCNLSTAETVNVVLTNRTNDTLRYIDWTCDSQIWVTDNKGLAVKSATQFKACGKCDKNIVYVYNISPHENRNFTLYLDNPPAPGAKSSFKIGMIVQRVVKLNDWTFYMDYFWTNQHQIKNQIMNIVWSNEIVYK
jgi:hypothetical protein